MTAPASPSLLGPTPWQLDTKRLAKDRRNALLLGLLFVAFGALALWFAGVSAGEALEDWGVWRKGEVGEVLDYSGDVRTSGPLGIPVFHDYKLDVTYDDAQGQKHTGHVEFSRLFSGVDQETNPEVHVQPQHPERFVLSWQVQAPRWLAALLFVLFPVLLFGGGFVMVRNERRRRALAGLCAEDGQELLVQLTSYTQQKGTHRVSVRLPAEGGAPARTHTEGLKRAPHLVERDGVQYAVVVRSPRAPGQVLLLEDDYSPFHPPLTSPALQVTDALKTGT